MTPGRERAIGLLAIAVLVLGSLGLWLARNLERTSQQIAMPPKGEAAYNPLYALKRTVQIDGGDAQSRRRLSLAAHPLGARDTVVLMGNLSAQGQDEAQRLLQWIAAGGHLIAAIPAYSGQPARAGNGMLLDALGAFPVPARLDDDERAICARLGISTDKKTGNHLSLCSPTRIALKDGAQVSAAWRDAGGHLFSRIRYGKGSVDLLADLRPLANASLDNPGHAAFARQLLAPNYRAGTVHLIYAAALPPWWRLLLERFWPALLPLAFAVGAWLWLRMQRFGQWLPSPEPIRRSLLEHVQASGELLHRHGRGHLLYEALRKRLQARLQRRHPVIAALDGQAQVQALATYTGLAESEIASALRAPVPFNAADLRLRIAKLNRLRNRL